MCLPEQGVFIVRNICTCPIFYFLFTCLFVYVAILPDKMTICDVCYTSVHCSFQDSVPLTYRTVSSDKSLSLLWLEIRRWASDKGGTVGFS